jgi:AcrR family transcriptional regulator
MESASPDIPRRLPRGSHGLDRQVVEQSQRTRLLEAVGRAVAERGFAAATIDDIVRRAGVSKQTFYDHFADKEGCFLAAYEAASAELLRRVRDARAAHEDWLERTRAGISAYLRWLAADPALARVFLIEVAAAGPLALERRERLRDRYAELMSDPPTSPGAPPPIEILHALVAAVDDVVVRHIREHGAERLPELEPTLLHLHAALLASSSSGAPGSARRRSSGSSPARPARYA